MDPLTSGFYAVVCGSLAAFAPQGATRTVRAAIGAGVGLVCSGGMADAAWIVSVMTLSTLGAAPHPPFGHLLPVRTGKKGRPAPLFPPPRCLRGEGGPKGRMRGSSEGAGFMSSRGASTDTELKYLGKTNA